MDEIYLTVKAVSDLKGCSERWIQKEIEAKSISYIEVYGQTSGQGGIQYRIPLSALDSKLQLKYKRLKRQEEKTAQSDIQPKAMPEPLYYEQLTADERQEMQKWKDIVQDWQRFRHSGESLSMVEKDALFIENANAKGPTLKLTYRTLARKWKDYNDKGEAALLDGRGKHGNHIKKLSGEVWDTFEYYYLDDSQKSIRLCMRLTELNFKNTRPEVLQDFPSETTFKRQVDKIPLPYIHYFRNGEKEFIGRCSPYIKRIYDDIESNDIWVADNHTFDVMLQDGTKTLRLYLTAFMDVRSRKMMGWCVTDRPCGDATIYALKKGIEKHGIPKMLYTDNGREFLFHDFGGNGFRKKKKEADTFQQPTILKQMGIDFKTALPRNARAKGIERAFHTVKENFSKLFEAYTGGNVLEKPDKLKEVVKSLDNLKHVDAFIGYVDTYLTGWYNKQPHTGEGMNGNSPDEVFAECLIEKRVATAEQLDDMFMRWSKPITVQKNGITLTFYEKKLQYSTQDLWLNYFGKKVYVRYNPDDLREVRVYDMEERLICYAPLKEESTYLASKDEIAKRQREVNSAVKAVKAYKRGKNIQATNKLDLILNEAAKHMDDNERIDPKILKPLFDYGDETALQKVSGESHYDEPIDWSIAIERLKNSKNAEV